MNLPISTLEATYAAHDRQSEDHDDLLARTDSVVAWAKAGLERSRLSREEADLDRVLDVLFGEAE